MFEAEEYIKTNNLEWELECHRTSPIGEVKHAFLAGATFGYNKVNEWNFTHRNKEHLVVDCPKGEENKLYLLLLNSRDSKEYEFGRKVPVVCYWNEKWSRFERLEHTIGERNVNQNDINAWKEIVLPELKESE